MFSKAQLDTFSQTLNRKRITQATFDDAVRENVEEFDMEVEEAVSSAIEEFKSQGVDLSNVYTGVGLQSHQAFVLSNQMREHIDQKDFDSLEVSVSSLHKEIHKHIEEDNSDQIQSLIAVLLAAETCALFELGLDALQADDMEVLLVQFLDLFSAILALSSDIRENFRKLDGVKKIPMSHQNSRIKCAALSVASSTAIKDEAGKAAVMSTSPWEDIIQTLRVAKDSSDHSHIAVQSTSSLIVALTTADDMTQPSSSAFSNARKLAQEGVAASLVDVLNMLWEEQPTGNEAFQISCHLCTALKVLAANDDICKELVDQGILDTLFTILRSSLVHALQAQTDLTASALGLLRQMLASDHVKFSVDTQELVDIVSSILQMYLDDAFEDTRVTEHAFGSITALCLRNPEASELTVDNGCAKLIVTSMQTLMDRKSGSKTPHNGIAKSLRQGCMALRNIASRSPSVRKPLQSYNAVDVIENAKVAAKAACTDVGDAAIRDICA
ncbi:hypothetical protein M9435_004057 [Picochlorum sp. BPE23]|nr:hypothetical protein M9435_004057 [Picochlorum sp. BPE23]